MDKRGASINMKRNYLLLFLLWLILFSAYCSLRSHTFISAFSHDEGLFLYGGQAWANGEIPYQDFWDHKPPGTFLLHSIPLRLFPFSVTALKLNQIFWLSLSALFLFLICKTRFSLLTTISTIVLYMFYTSAPFTIRTGGLTEESALFFVMLGFWIMLRRQKISMLHTMLAGVAIGAAIQFRQTFVFSSIFILGIIINNHLGSKRKWSEIWKPVLSLSCGMIIPELVISIYFLWHGVWFDYIEASYLVNFLYVGSARPSKTITDILNIQWTFIVSSGPYLLSPILALGVMRWLPKKLRWMIVPLIINFIAELWAISLSREYYQHYYVQASVTMSLLLAIFIEGAYCSVKSAVSGSGSLRYAIMAFTSLLLILSLTALGLGVTQYVDDYGEILINHAEEESEYAFQQDAARVVNHLTEADDKILLIGRDPNSIYILAQRCAASRFYHFSPLWKKKLLDAVTPSQQQAFLNDLQEKRPVLLLIDRRISRMLREDRDFINSVNDIIEQKYMPLEDIVDQSPEDAFFWYGSRFTILVRNDRQKKVIERFKDLSG